MEGARLAVLEPLATAGRVRARPDLPAIGGWALGFAIVGYLALANGGYDTVVRTEVGVAVWWLVLLGAWRAGARPAAAAGMAGRGRSWPGCASGPAWHDLVGERGADHHGTGAVCDLPRRAPAGAGDPGPVGRALRARGAACAIAAVACLAVLSRVRPEWFPRDDHARSSATPGAWPTR
jgi:hypothetical protein